MLRIVLPGRHDQELLVKSVLVLGGYLGPAGKEVRMDERLDFSTFGFQLSS